MPAELTIEQLAAQTGMTVRNIRAHQARGLLSPPEVRLRVGYYGPEHVAQLELIRDLQEDGFNLAGIKRLLDDDQGTAERLARFRRALTEPPHAELSQTLTLAELGRRFRVSTEEAPRVMARAQRLGVLVAAGEDRYEVPSPLLLAVAEQVVARGVSLNGALAVFEQIEEHCDAVSRAFLSLFMSEVWEPFQADGMPTERWPEIDESIERLRPLATDALLAIFGQRMSSQIEDAFGQLTRRLAPPPATAAGRSGRGSSWGRIGWGPMSAADPEEQRAVSRENWEAAAEGWGRSAERVRDWGMPVSRAMIESLDLQPGERLLELAAGPGDTGFMAAELIALGDDGAAAGLAGPAGPAAPASEAADRRGAPPAGTLVSSDGAEAMLEIARARAAALGIENVEFRQLELEWIDLPTASVDAVLCRWGIMLIVDPEAAAQEIRRVLAPGGRAALAVWDVPERNPWSTITNSAMVDLGHAPPPDPDAPGPFSLAAEGRLLELLEDAGFTEVQVTAIPVQRRYRTIDEFIAETAELSPTFRRFRELDPPQQTEVLETVALAAQPYTADDGSLVLPGSSLVARASA